MAEIMALILAIDPGPAESAYVLYDEVAKVPEGWGKMLNLLLLREMDRMFAPRLGIEMVASYGMPVGAEVFETCVWVGRFIERYMAVPHRSWKYVYRREVKLHLCGDSRAKDGNIRQSLIDRYGPSKQVAVGLKKSPGPLYGFSGDGWAALGVAITADETP